MALTLLRNASGHRPSETLIGGNVQHRKGVSRQETQKFYPNTISGVINRTRDIVDKPTVLSRKDFDNCVRKLMEDSYSHAYRECLDHWNVPVSGLYRFNSAVQSITGGLATQARRPKNPIPNYKHVRKVGYLPQALPATLGVKFSQGVRVLNDAWMVNLQSTLEEQTNGKKQVYKSARRGYGAYMRGDRCGPTWPNYTHWKRRDPRSGDGCDSGWDRRAA